MTKLSNEHINAVGTIYGELNRQHVKLSAIEREQVDKLLDKLKHDNYSLETIKLLMSKVSEENYRMGAERQKEATFENVYRVIKELEGQQ